MPERPQFELDRDAERRREIQFTPRDDVRDFARSGLGRNYFAIENLQAQAPTFTKDDPRIDELKQRRRTWNRSQKYPAGEILGKTPQQMQNEYMGLSRGLRQTANPVYNRMYPITGKFMDVAEKGGLWGTLLSGLARKTKKNIMGYGKDLLEKKGILGTADSSPQDQIEYAEETFGPNMYDVAGPWFGTAPIEDVEISDLPDEPLRVQKQDWVDDIIEEDTFSDLPYHSKRSMFPRDNRRVIPGYGTTYIDEPDTVEDIEPLKFEDYIDRGNVVPSAITPYEGREFGLGQFMNEMPTSMKSNWEDYLEYSERLGDMEGGHLEYDEWHDMMRRRR